MIAKTSSTVARRKNSDKSSGTRTPPPSKGATLAALVPRPRLHLIRFHGVLAPNAKLRPLVVPQGPAAPEQANEAAAADQCEVEKVQARPQRISWAPLLKRVLADMP